MYVNGRKLKMWIGTNYQMRKYLYHFYILSNLQTKTENHDTIISEVAILACVENYRQNKTLFLKPRESNVTFHILK